MSRDVAAWRAYHQARAFYFDRLRDAYRAELASERLYPLRSEAEMAAIEEWIEWCSERAAEHAKLGAVESGDEGKAA